MNQKGFAPVLLVLVLAIVGVAGIVYLKGTGQVGQLVTSQGQKACTLEAKICPDGSSVGRTGPNCEFSECPTQGSSSNLKTYQNNYFSISYPSTWIIGETTNMYVEFVKTDGPINEVTQKKSHLAISSSENPLNYAGCSNPYTTTNDLIVDGEMLTLGVQKQQNQYVGSVTKDLNNCSFAKEDINFGINFYSKDDITIEVKEILSTIKFK